MTHSDQHWLAQALTEAERGLGQCAPNPAVGAVIVKGKQWVSSGWHRGPGHDHAEVMACKQSPSGFDYRGATLYVTLEPCCHTGRTPPCTELIIAKQFARVVFAQYDPNPRVAGKGQQQLQAAGIVCEHVSLPAIQRFYRPYCYWWQTKRPWVIAKLAQSLDGAVAGPAGEPIQITGAAAQQFTHQQRARADAILTTAQTVQCDDPALNVRLSGKVSSKPVYVLDRQLTLLHPSQPPRQLFTTACPLVLIHDINDSPPENQAQQHSLSMKVDYLPVAAQADRLSLPSVVEQLAAKGHQQIWLEAGPRLFSAMLQADLLAQAYVYVAPRVLGSDHYPGLCQPGLFAHATQTSWQVLGDDAVCCFDFL